MRRTGPEKTITEPIILSIGKRLGFDLTVVDTSAVWNPQAGRYLRKQASESLPDLIGNWGIISVWIELKAPGERRAITHKKNAHQMAFLKRKIQQGCFAICTDSAEHFIAIFNKWKSCKDLIERRAVLLADLPQERITMLYARQGTSSMRRRVNHSK